MRLHTKKMLLIGLATLMLGASAYADDAASTSLAQEDVLVYLEQLTQWQHEATALTPSANSTREMIFQDTLQQSATSALKSGFKFARLQAAASQPAADAPSTDDSNPSPHQRMMQRLAETQTQVTQLQQQLKASHLSADQRKTLDGHLRLATAKEELFQNVLANINEASSKDAKGMAGKINDLARDIPELNPQLGKAPAIKSADGAAAPTLPMMPAMPATADSTATTPDTHPANTILSISGALFDTIRLQSDLRDFAEKTHQLEETNRNLLKTLRTELDQITDTTDSKQSIDDQLASFHQIGGLIMPLGEAMLAVNSSETALKNWQTALQQNFHTLLTRLGIKVAILAALLAVPLVLGEAVKRAINRYLTDNKRKRWAHTARRIVVGVAVLFILLLSFVSDFSSFATFAGFLTAGLAVALQGVLMSLVAHFFFYGRYGVRAGDKVNVSGVTGEIVQIGMTRFYLRELTGENGSWKEHGRIVAFPNSILFQPQAFYKYID